MPFFHCFYSKKHRASCQKASCAMLSPAPVLIKGYIHRKRRVLPGRCLAFFLLHTAFYVESKRVVMYSEKIACNALLVMV